MGAAVIAGSAFAGWLEVAGSRLSGFRLAEIIGGYGDHVAGVPPAWVAAVWFLFPASAGVCRILLFRNSPPAISRAHAPIGAAVAIAAAAWPRFQETVGESQDDIVDLGLGELFELHAPESIHLMTVRQGGRWYISPLYSVAEFARRIADLPRPTSRLPGRTPYRARRAPRM